ncbi:MULTISPECIES: cell wall metabolism sensor histidine kinase WalK [unclassified Aeromicrobium]|uniref:sensor histidine kinase n=1 Tax=unclassified Aeromicrobium TaxID=2633570 RepID=UPI0006F688B3|nr:MULTISPECIES: ATP-binding protein [unclassified Aeromicrobium]RYY49016.1 MAG: sensor histidine kinase [Actinomycetales bacterium]KQO36349.1 histidine kinase [Aeromicrobium sp. Leaf245]KQP27819.1 histidine kinase [Aeromicrobium sp. Leaf272]KQP78431.1 histidine kinase [Aeromicrobium sp. Leaf289]KQP84141.1 histidine kinase [Aeromicrobium sp. Leaf291]
MDISAGLVVAGAVGTALGAAVTFLWLFSERRQNAVPDEPTPLVPPGAEAVLSVLSSTTVLLGPSDEVLQASAPAVALGIVRDNRIESEDIRGLVQQVRRDGQVRESNLTLQRRRGTPAHVQVRVAPLTSRLIIVLALDRTDQQRVENIRRDFVANVSHELKTPVGALNLLAEAVSEAKDDPESVVRFASRMQTESERLTRLVQQIIDLSRLQNDVASEDAATVKVDELVAEACEHSATESERKQIEIARSVEPDLMVHGDRAQLHAAVSNLVENAVTYSPEGSKVAVTAALDGDDVRISVADNGIGIAGPELERIFERFYRVDPARARATGGTGLGLSIVKHVAASNGGSVDVWSEPGAGSTFTLVLPRFQHDLDEEIP